MRNFFDDSEDYDWELLNSLNDHTHWFLSLHRFPRGEHIDVSGVTRDDRKAFIELKNRDKVYDGLFIEPTKVEAFKASASTDEWLTLYFNFIGDDLYWCDPLEHLDEMELQYPLIWNKGKKKMERVPRYNIPLNCFKKWKMKVE